LGEGHAPSWPPHRPGQNADATERVPPSLASILFADINKSGGNSGYGKRRRNMLETIIVVLVILWLLGLVTSHTMGGLLHVLLVLAIVVVLIRVIQGRRV
jgi:hypothetical protein